MQKYVLHEAVSDGLFDRNHCSAGGALSAWGAELTNSPPILAFLCQRMESDYESLTAKMRKPFNTASVDTRLIGKLIHHTA